VGSSSKQTHILIQLVRSFINAYMKKNGLQCRFTFKFLRWNKLSFNDKCNQIPSPKQTKTINRKKMLSAENGSYLPSFQAKGLILGVELEGRGLDLSSPPSLPVPSSLLQSLSRRFLFFSSSSSALPLYGSFSSSLSSYRYLVRPFFCLLALFFFSL